MKIQRYKKKKIHSHIQEYILGLLEYWQVRRRSGRKNSQMEKQILNGPECHASRFQHHTQDSRNHQKFLGDLYFRNITLKVAEGRQVRGREHSE